jgi:hypothetical protein
VVADKCTIFRMLAESGPHGQVYAVTKNASRSRGRDRLAAVKAL